MTIENIIKKIHKKHKNNNVLDIFFGCLIIQYYEQYHKKNRFKSYLLRYKETHVNSLQYLFNTVNIPLLSKISVKHDIFEEIMLLMDIDLLTCDFNGISKIYEEINQNKKAEAAYYTHKEYSYEIINDLFNNIQEDQINNLKIFDPTSGCGNFIIDTIEYFHNKFPGKIHLDNFISYEYSLTSSLLNYLRILDFSKKLNIPGKILIEVCDSIQKDWPENITHIIGNPPFIHNGSRSYKEAVKYNEKYKDNFLKMKSVMHLNYSLLWLFKSIDYINSNKNCIHFMIYPSSVFSEFQFVHIKQHLENKNVFVNNVIHKNELFNGCIGTFTKFVKLSSINNNYKISIMAADGRKPNTHKMYQYSSEVKINDIRCLDSSLDKKENIFNLKKPTNNIVFINKTFTNNNKNHVKFNLEYETIYKHTRNVYLFKNEKIFPFLSKWFKIFVEYDAKILHYTVHEKSFYKLKMLYFKNFPIDEKLKFRFTYEEFIESYKKDKEECLAEINKTVNDYFIKMGYNEGEDKIEFLNKLHLRFLNERYTF